MSTPRHPRANRDRARVSTVCEAAESGATKPKTRAVVGSTSFHELRRRVATSGIHDYVFTNHVQCCLDAALQKVQASYDLLGALRTGQLDPSVYEFQRAEEPWVVLRGDGPEPEFMGYYATELEADRRVAQLRREGNTVIAARLRTKAAVSTESSTAQASVSSQERAAKRHKTR